MSDQQPMSAPICPHLGVQSYPVKRSVASVSPSQEVQIQDRFHPCLGPQCAWWIITNQEEGRGMCAVTMIAMQLATWQSVETA